MITNIHKLPFNTYMTDGKGELLKLTFSHSLVESQRITPKHGPANEKKIKEAYSVERCTRRIHTQGGMGGGTYKGNTHMTSPQRCSNKRRHMSREHTYDVTKLGYQ